MINKLKKIIIILLLIVLKDNILTMNPGYIEKFEQNLNLLDLPQEIIYLIIYKIAEPYINKINKTDRILKFYNIDLTNLKKDLKNLLQCSKALRTLTLDLIKNTEMEKLKKEKFLINNVKTKYMKFNTKELNIKLQKILNEYYLKKGHLEKMIKLILAGADINQKNNNGINPLILTLIKGYKNIAKQFINCQSININDKNNLGDNALIWATLKGYKDIVELLLNHKDINVNEKNNFENTALILAVTKGNIDILKLLLDYKDINVNQKNNYGRTALMVAVLKGNINIVELLLNHNKIDVNIQDNEGDTALIFASKNGYKEIVKLLINRQDIDLNQKNNSGYNALRLAKKVNNKDIVLLIKEVKKDNPQLCLNS